jgi:tripartite-type tricarboxylate transporter receptor subunit TctC
VQGGAVKALAVSTRQRMPQLPNVPTVAETIPDFEYVAWNGYAAAGPFPQEAVDRLVAALKVIGHDPDVIKRFATLGIESVGTTQEEAIASIRKDMPIYSKIVDMAGVRIK